MRPEFRLIAILDDNPFQRVERRLCQDHFRKPGLGVRGCNKVGQVPDWPGDGHGWSSNWLDRLFLDFINEFAVPWPGLYCLCASMSGDLHRDG